MKPGRYIYFTRNVTGMVDFYRDKLGMEKVDPPEAMDVDPSSWVQLRSGSFEVAIHTSPKPGSPSGNRNKLVLLVDDVGAARQDLMDRGVKVGKHDVFKEYESCDFHDPDGNVLQLSNR